MEEHIQNFMKNKSPRQMKMIALVLVVLAVLGSIVWGLALGPLNSFLGERGLKLDSDSPLGVNIDAEKLWPPTMPELVPPINQGEIWDQVSEPDVWNVRFRNLPAEVGEDFKLALIEKGWTITGETRNEEAQTMHLYAEYNRLILDFSQNFEVGSGTLKVEQRELWEID